MYNTKGFVMIESKTADNIFRYICCILNKANSTSNCSFSLYHDTLNVSIDKVKEQIFTMKTCDDTYIAKLNFEYKGTQPFEETIYSLLDISESSDNDLNKVINSTVFDFDYYEKHTSNTTLKHFDIHTIPSYKGGIFKIENEHSDQNCFKCEYTTFNLMDPNLKFTTYNPAEVIKT